MDTVAFKVEDQIGHIVVQRPEKLNAIDLPTKQAMIDQLEGYKNDDDVRVVYFHSQGDKAFSVGGDLKEVAAKEEVVLEPFADSWEELFTAMTTLGKPTVAKVDGYALGGGFDLLLHTDIVVATDDAKIGQPEINLGLVNHFSPPVLQRMVGFRRTLEIMMLGEQLTAQEAVDMDLITRCVPAEEIDEEVDEILETLKEKSPRVMNELKDALYTSFEMSPRSGRSHIEQVAIEGVKETNIHAEGVHAQVEGREPEWPE